MLCKKATAFGHWHVPKLLFESTNLFAIPFGRIETSQACCSRSSRVQIGLGLQVERASSQEMQANKSKK